MTLWWLSFVDPHRPEGTRFLGVALVEAETMADALRRAWSSGCNPGGEVEAYELPLDMPRVGDGGGRGRRAP
jgi:hypothetical protein